MFLLLDFNFHLSLISNRLCPCVWVKIILYIHLPPWYCKWSSLALQYCLACGLSAIVFLCERVQRRGMCLNYGGGKLHGSQVAAIRLYTLFPLLFELLCVCVCGVCLLTMWLQDTSAENSGALRWCACAGCGVCVCLCVRNQRQRLSVLKHRWSNRCWLTVSCSPTLFLLSLCWAPTHSVTPPKPSQLLSCLFVRVLKDILSNKAL